VRTLNEKEYFGERALFLKELRSASATAKGDIELFSLNFTDFQQVIDNHLRDYLFNSLCIHDYSIELEDLDYSNKLGEGSYGHVFLVINRQNKFKYALKAVSKYQIDSELLHENIGLEKKILLMINHPFIFKLIKTLKDQNNIYFLMEYVKGKDLWDVINELGILDKNQTQFYSASLLVAVNYLHQQKIIYRDIKPENVIVTENVFNYT